MLNTHKACKIYSIDSIVYSVFYSLYIAISGK